MTSAPPSKLAYRELASHLRTLILTHELKAGDKLPGEAQLCAQYGVSRSTAREALRSLSSEGLIVTKRGVTGGSFVREPDLDGLSEQLETGIDRLSAYQGLSVEALLEVREILEVPAAGLAAERRTGRDVKDLWLALEHHDHGTEDRYAHHRDFHAIILRSSGNPLLELIARPVYRVLQTRFLRDLAPASFWRKTEREHREIIGLIEAQDDEGAREAARSHLRRLQKTYKRIDVSNPP